MKPIKLKSIVEQIQSEATLYPKRDDLNQIRKILEDFLDKRGKKGIGKELRDFYYTIKMKDWFTLLMDAGENFSELNYKLKPYRIEFVTHLDDATGGVTCWKDGKILINPKSFSGAAKVNGKWNLDYVMRNIGHELIHQDQVSRGMNNSKFVEPADESEYLNDRYEVMTWAHTYLQDMLSAAPEISYQEAIELIRSSNTVKKFLSNYTYNNRKKFLRYLVDYVREEFESRK